MSITPVSTANYVPAAQSHAQNVQPNNGTQGTNQPATAATSRPRGHHHHHAEQANAPATPETVGGETPTTGGTVNVVG